MKLSNATIKVTPEDILNIIEEYVNVEGLIIREVKLGEIITISGSYRKGVEIPFQASVGFGNIKDNVIYIKIFKFKIYKLGVIKSIKNFAFKTFLKDLTNYGVLAQGDNLIVDLNMIVKLIPYVNLDLETIRVIDNNLEIEANNVIYAPDKETPDFKNKKSQDTKNKIKISDRYTKLRVNIEDKVPDKCKDIIEYAMLIPDFAALLWRLFRDKRVNIKIKMLVGGLLAYLASPIDIIPDFIPLIGKVDDVAIILFAMNKIINEVPEEVILSNWTGKDNVIKIVSEGVTFISKMVGSQNVGKLLESVKKLYVVNKKEDNKGEAAQNN